MDPIAPEGDPVLGAARVAMVDAMLSAAPVKIARHDNGLFHGLVPWETIAIRQCLQHTDRHDPCIILHSDDATIYQTALSDLVAETQFARISTAAPDEMKSTIRLILASNPLASCILLNGLLNRIPNPKSLLTEHLKVLKPGAILAALVLATDKDQIASKFNFQIGFSPITIQDLSCPDVGNLVCFGTQSREFSPEWPHCALACAGYQVFS
jgi:hypothetical protein